MTAVSGMRAVQYTRTGEARDVLELCELERPEPDRNELRVALRASGVNPHDTKKRSGWTGATLDGPVIPHSDGAGIIEAVGEGVDPARIGERVFIVNAPPGRGTAAEAVVVPAERTLPLPGCLSFVEGAALGVPHFTAWLAVLGDGPVAGQTLLVQGGGGAVGRVAVELAVLSEATVIATGRSDHARGTALRSGAHLVLPTGSPELLPAILEHSGGRGASRVVDVDFAANQDADIAALASHGTLAAYSCSSDRAPVLDYYAFARKAARLTFVQGADLLASQIAAAGQTLGAHLEAGRLRPAIAATFPLDRTADAHEAVEAGARGNIVVTCR